MLFPQRQVVPKEYVPYLPHLVRLGFPFPGLQVKDLFDCGHRENMVIAPNPFRETEFLQQLAEVSEWDIRIATAQQDVLQQLLVSVHVSKMITAFGLVPISS
jgi:hypothetical protein